VFPVEPVVLPPCFCCTGPTGAIGARLSLRPPSPEGVLFSKNSGASAPRERGMLRL